MAVFTRTENTNPSGLEWDITAQWVVVGTPTSTLVRLSATDGSVNEIVGTGFTFNGNTPTGGTIESITQVVSIGGLTIRSLTGLNHSLVELFNTPSAAVGALLLNGNDIVNGNSGGNTLAGFGGNDTMFGNGGGDTLDAGAGFDNVYGGAGNDTIYGGANEDVLVGDSGNDTIYGGDGGDVLSELFDPINSGDDVFDGGNGVDIMYSAAGNDTVYGGTDTANNYGNLGDGADSYFGSAGTDVVQGGNGNDMITGGDGDDSLYGEGDNDTIYGGNGIDLLSGSTGNDTLDGGAGNDLLVGDEGTDTLLGGAGIDVLYGFADDDILNGGTGGDVDALYGGAGNDSFQVGGAGYGIDYIWDFVGGVGASDRILVAAGVSITSQSASSGNYYINFNNGSQAVVVGRTSVLPEDIVLNGF